MKKKHREASQLAYFRLWRLKKFQREKKLKA